MNEKNINTVKPCILVIYTLIVIGDTPFDGVEDGIYDQYRGGEFDEKFSYPLLHRNRVSSVFGLRWIS